MTRRYQLAIVGTGTAAMVAAMRVRAAGWSVAIIDFRPFGGTCALRGCDPKKMLIGGASAVDHARRMRSRGVDGAAGINWADLMAFKRGFTDPIPARHEQLYRDKGIATYHGRARFTGPNRIAVNDELLDAEHVLIASGAEAVPLGIQGEQHLIANEAFLALAALPRRIALVGGGYIAAEFAHIAARAGADVTILQRGDRMLKEFDPDLVGWLMEKFATIGVEVRLQTRVEAVEKAGGAYRVSASVNGQPLTLEADLVVHAAGRAAALDTLDLPAAGVATESGRVKLNEYLQSVSNPAVYAAGDAAHSGPPLTPVSSHDAKVVAANLLHGNHVKPNYKGVPSVAFTIPPIARVGLSEARVRAQGVEFRMKSEKACDWFTARQAAESIYGFKVMVDAKSDLVLGAHLVGPHVDEVINVFALAIRHDLTAEDLKTTMFAYPTGASDLSYLL